MHWLTILFHYIVCNIYDIVDRTDSVCCQSVLHPFRRWSNLDIFNDSCTVTGTEVCIFNFYFNVIIDIFAVSGLCHYRRYKFFSKSCSSFSCDTKDAEAVYTVGCDLVLYNYIIQTKCFDGTLAYNSIFRHDIQTIFRCCRIIISGRAKFLDRTHHSVGRDTS